MKDQRSVIESLEKQVEGIRYANTEVQHKYEMGLTGQQGEGEERAERPRER